MDEHRTEVRDLIAAMDQANASLADVAAVLGGYRRELVAAGFSEEDAVDLCIEVQRGMLTGVNLNDRD